MDASPRKVEHANAPDPGASADPAADLAAMLTEARGWAEGTALSDDANRKIWLMHLMADAIERLLRERGMLTARLNERLAQCDLLRAERDAALAKGELLKKSLDVAISNIREAREAQAAVRAEIEEHLVGAMPSGEQIPPPFMDEAKAQVEAIAKMGSSITAALAKGREQAAQLLDRAAIPPSISLHTPVTVYAKCEAAAEWATAIRALSPSSPGERLEIDRSGWDEEGQL